MDLEKVKLKNIGRIVTGCTPKTKKEEYYKTKDYMFVGPTDLKLNKYVRNSEKYISNIAYKDYSIRFIDNNSVMVDCIGSDMGNVALSVGKLLTNQQINSITEIDEIRFNIEYIYYVLSTMKKYFHQIGTNGSTMPIINKTMFEEIEIAVPKKYIQDKVVKILSSIDNKIELNNKINDNLFEISCLNYKKWYEKLNSNLETTYSKLKELGNIVMGQSPKGESYNFEKVGVPLINGAADYENGYLMAQKYTSMPTKICKKDDFIFCIRATIGLLVISDNEYCLGRGVAGITNINNEYKEYAFHIIYNSIEEFKKLATGSVIVGISRNDIEDIKVKIPTMEQIHEFHRIQSPIFKRMENIRIENQILIKLRDSLLPKLMNGEIDLDKIEI